MSRWLYVRGYIAFVLAASLVVPTMMFIELDVPHWYVGIILVMSLVSGPLSLCQQPYLDAQRNSAMS